MAIWKMTKKSAKKLGSVFTVIFNVLLKISLIIIMLFYIIMGVTSVYVIVEREYIKSRPAVEVNEILDRAVLTNRLNEIEKWIRYRENSEIEYIAEAVKPKSSHIGAVIFFSIAGKYYKLGNIEEGLFWFNLGQYRLRYDVLRCGASESIAYLGNIINIAYDTDMGDIYKDDIKLLKSSLKKMIAFDKAYPPKNDMEEVCFMVSQLEGGKELTIASEEEWPVIREKLIKSAQDFVDSK